MVSAANREAASLPQKEKQAFEKQAVYASHAAARNPGLIFWLSWYYSSIASIPCIYRPYRYTAFIDITDIMS